MVRNPTPTCHISVSSTAEALPKKMKDDVAMYPKVKVRMDKYPDEPPAAHDHNRCHLLSLKDFESLFLEDSSNSPEVLLFPRKEHHVSPSSTAKIPKDYCPTIVKPSTSESQEAERCRKVDEDNKVNIRASSIPMPRAVVSSPENDLMIGKKNRKTAEKPAVLKNHNSVQSRHALCKIIPSHGGTENPINSRKLKEVDDSKSHHNGKNGIAFRGCHLKSNKTS